MEEIKVREEISVPAFVLGIISVITPIFYYIAIPTGILSIILGIKEYKKSKSKLGLTGFILGIIGLSVTALFSLLAILIVLANVL